MISGSTIIIIGIIILFLLTNAIISYVILGYIDKANCSDTDENAQQAKVYITYYAVSTTIIAILMAFFLFIYLYYSKGKKDDSKKRRFSPIFERTPKKESRKSPKKETKEKTTRERGLFRRLSLEKVKTPTEKKRSSPSPARSSTPGISSSRSSSGRSSEKRRELEEIEKLLAQ